MVHLKAKVGTLVFILFATTATARAECVIENMEQLDAAKQLSEQFWASQMCKFYKKPIESEEMVALMLKLGAGVQGKPSEDNLQCEGALISERDTVLENYTSDPVVTCAAARNVIEGNIELKHELQNLGVF